MSKGGGNRIISGGVQNRFWGGDLWYVFPSPEFPPPLFFSEKMRNFSAIADYWDAQGTKTGLDDGVRESLICLLLGSLARSRIAPLNTKDTKGHRPLCISLVGILLNTRAGGLYPESPREERNVGAQSLK